MATAEPAWSVAPVPSWVARVEPASTDAPITGEANDGGRYLLFDRQTRVGTTVESYTRWSRQIINQAGLAASSQLRVDFDPSYQTLAIHSVTVRRGSESLNRLVPSAIKIVQREPNLEAQVFDGQQSAILFIEDLRVGDIVECAYTLRGADPTAQGHFTDTILLGAPEPVARLHARLLMTGGRQTRLKIHAPDGNRAPYGVPPVTTPEGTEYTWDIRDVRPYLPEPNVPSWYVPYAWVQATDFESWAEVAAWATRLFKVETPTRGHLNDWVKTVRSEAASPDIFLLRAIRFVQDEIRYVGIETGMSRRRPTDPTKVFDRRYGDCKDKATLLVTILQLGGISAIPSLVSTTHGHTLDELAPSGTTFDHVIVRVTGREGKVYWVDATVALQGGGLDALQYSPFELTLPVSESTTRLSALARRPVERPSPTIRDHVTVFLPDSKTETLLDSERVYEDETADAIRHQLRGMTREQITKYFLSTYQATYPTIREAAAFEQNDDRDGNVLRIVVHLAIPHFWELDPKMGQQVGSLMPRLVASTLFRPQSGKRTAPLAFPHPMRMQSTIDIDLPFDLALTSESVTETDDAFELRFTSALEGRHLTYSYALRSRAAVVEPAAFAAYLEHVDKAYSILGRSLTYRTPQADGFNWTGFVALLGSLPFVAFAAFRLYRYDRPLQRPFTGRVLDPTLRGIGGWLGFMCISIVGGPIFGTVNFFKTARVALSLASWRRLTTPELPSYAPSLALTIIAETIFIGAIVLYGCVVAVLFFKKRRAFPFHFTVYATGMAAFQLIDHAVAGAFLSGTAASSESIAGVVRTMIWAAVWIAYVRKSRRVEATFVTRPPRRRRRPRPRSRDEAADHEHDPR